MKISLKLAEILQNKPLINLFIYGIGQLFNLLTPILVVPYIVTVCTETGYGKIGIAMAISFFLMVFVDYGTDIIGVREVSINRTENEKLEEIFITTYTSKLILLLVIIAIAAILFSVVPYFRTEKTLFLLSLPMLIGQFINPTWFLQGLENFKWITIITIISKITYVIGIFVFMKYSSDYVYNNLIWGLGMILANGICFVYLILSKGFDFRKVKKNNVKNTLQGNFSMFSSQIFVSLQMYSPIVLIGFFGNNALAGQYKIIDQIIVVFKTYIILFFNYVYPRVCFLLEKSKAEGLRFWRIYNGLNFIFMTISMTIVGVFSYYVVGYFNPVGTIHISQLLKIAIFIPLIQSIVLPLKQLVLGWNHQKSYVRITMITTILCMIMVTLVTPLFKVTGVLFSLITVEIVVILFYFNTIKKNLYSRLS